MRARAKRSGSANGRLLLAALVWLVGVRALAAVEDDHWWPAQAFPKAIVRTTNQQEFSEPRLALQMMVQSVAGLAALAVNEGRGDELVWVDNGGGDLEKWYSRMVARHPDLVMSGTFGPWALVDRYTKKGVIKGYILYRSDKSQGENNAERPGIIYSVNVATSLAGLLGGIIVDEGLENEAKAHGLKLLLDVRDKTQLWCFQTYKDQFNHRMLCFQDPRVPHTRDLAIAQKVFTTYGTGEPTTQAMAWLEPLSPILGWNCGDEFETTDLSSGYGDIQTASNWNLNLPVLMAEAGTIHLPKLKQFDPRTIDWADSRSSVAFVSTDGDNVQWITGNFFSNASYWGDPKRGKIPFGWSCCLDQLVQLCPEAIEYAAETRTTNDCFVEWGGGYYYPDRFGSQRTNRWELLAQHGRRTWNLMRQTNERIISFNFSRVDSVETRRACEVFAGQTDGLLAILAYQYAPYEAGGGKVFWVRDRTSNEIPVITACYSIWEHSNERERAGTPAKVAREMRQAFDKTDTAQSPHYEWTIAHVWSYFKNVPGTDEEAENMPQDNAAENGGVRGYSPVLWCANRLPSNIRVVNPEEMAWRIRMRHNPSQTRKLISEFK